MIFLKKHINSTTVIRPLKQNQLSFSSIDINKPLTAPVQCLVDQIQANSSWIPIQLE